jgi:RNA polymerase sigma factor (sigma-70 family)
MALTPLRDGLRLLGRAAAPGSAGVPDADLLARFARDRDEAAFELLVWRHGAMVLGTCRRLLRDRHDAEDAAQACFLILAHRAGAVGRRGSVGGWLHRVAFRVALRAQARRARRDAGRQPLDAATPATGTPDPEAAAEWREARGALDDEVNRLPDRFRVPFVLCCLEGRAAADAARALGCPVGTVESRLTRARERLRAALGRRGVALPAGLFAALPAGNAAAALPPGFATATARAIVPAGAGPAAQAASAHVIALTEGMIQSMWLAKLKAAAALTLAAAALGTGTSILWHQPAAADPIAANPPAKAPAPAEADRIDELVRRLGGPAFADRERAAKELEAIGTPTLPALRGAAGGDDPERKKQSEELVKRIEARAAAAKVLAAKRVRLNYRDTPLAEAVADFKAKSGYDIVLTDPAALKDRRVTLNTGDVTFWQAVSRFCEAAGLTEAPSAGPGPAAGAGGGFGGGGAGGGRGGLGGGPVVGASPFAVPGRVALVEGKRSVLPTDDGTAVRVRALGHADGTAADGETLIRLEVSPRAAAALAADPGRGRQGDRRPGPGPGAGSGCRSGAGRTAGHRPGPYCRRGRVRGAARGRNRPRPDGRRPAQDRGQADRRSQGTVRDRGPAGTGRPGRVRHGGRDFGRRREDGQGGRRRGPPGVRRGQGGRRAG